MARNHQYSAHLTWTGNQGEGTANYKAYTRDYDIDCEGKPVVKGSADPAYYGDAARHNPEDMLLASLSACHMLWYLHLCALRKVVVIAYEDFAEGALEVNSNGSGQFTRVKLQPRVTIAPESDAEMAEKLHERANTMCFVARSVNFPVTHNPTIRKPSGH